MRPRKFVAVLFVFSLMFGGIVRAQVSTGTISGTVKDSSGAVLPGAKVVVLNEGTGISRTIETDANGHYSALSLSLGSYRVTGAREGFGTVVRTGIVLTVAQEEVVDLTLSVGSVAQSVVVTGAAPLVESTTASEGSLVDDKTIRELPLNGRSYDQLALLQPGVNLTSPGNPSGVIMFTFGSGARFSVGGQLPNANLFLLDGTDVNDQANGTPGGASGTNLGVDTILEFKIFTSVFKAEFGHSTGSVITSVTRSGTNSLHGTVFEYIRNSVLDASNFFDIGHTPPPFRRNQFGGVLGGPIKKDKLFFFVGYEGLRQGLATTQTAIVPDANARQGILPTGTVPVNPVVVPYLNTYPLPNGPDLGNGEAEFFSAPTVPTNEDNGMARVDYLLNANNTIFARYWIDQDSVTSPQSLPDQVIDIASRRQYATVQLNSVLGAKALNNFRFAYNRTYSTQNELITGEAPPSFVAGQELGGITLGGTLAASSALTPLGTANGNGPSLWAWNIIQTGDDFSYVRGKHSLKTGVDVQRVQDNTLFDQQIQGFYTFSTFTTFLAGTPATFGAGYPLGEPAYWRIRQTLVGVYGQDDYTVNSRLTLNLGLRWEAPTDPTSQNGLMAILPSPSATSTVVSNKFFSVGKKNIEPRFGLAWQLDASGKTVLRLGAGIYHNQILPWAYSQQTRNPPFFGLYQLSNPPFPDGASLLTGSPKAGTIDINSTAPFNKTPVADQYSLSIQREITKSTVVEVEYVGNRANHIFISDELDTPVPIICSTTLDNCPAGVPNGAPYYPLNAPRQNTAWAGEKIISSGGDGYPGGNSIYNGGTVRFRRQSSSGLVGQIFYTYSKAMDEGSSISGSEDKRSPTGVMYPGHPGLDWSLSDFNVTNALGSNFSYPLPFRAGSKALGAVVNGWNLDGILTFTSGQPFTITDATNISRDKETNGLADRPNLNPGFSSSPISGVSPGCPGLAAGTPVGTPAHWFDPCAFSLEPAGTFGDLRRNSVIGPGVESVDFALVKAIPIHEQFNATFRAEVFNIMNHANFGLPNTVALTATGAASPTAGQILYTVTSSRQIQFGLRLNF
jgi:hypothetical protein